MIKDSKGKPHMVFDKDKSKEDENMGENVDDYEILQVLGEGSFGFVAKAKSKLNHKIYAIKQINFASLKSEKAIELCQNEIVILKNLNHPSITKYYKSIKEGDCLYIIMEFMDNGDLSGLIKAHKSLNKPINEEKVWNIFIQAMESLAFIHSKNLIHRDIKPENLFISNDGTLKLGDFGVSASMIEKQEQDNLQNMQKELISKWICKGTCVGTPPFMSPEMLKKTEYDLNTDVYSMGCAFFETLFWIYPRTPVMDIAAIFNGKDVMNLVDLPIKNNKDFYSKELVSIIYQMIEKDKNKRPNSKQVLDKLKIEFNKKYSCNSCIGSILSCLYSYKEISEYFKINTQAISQNSVNKPISYAFLYGLNAFNFNINEDWNNALCNIRSILIQENNIYEGNKEIEPRIILSYLIGKMHHELNTCINNYSSPFSTLFSPEISNSNEQNSLDFSDKNKSANLFISTFKKNNSSIIIDLFFGIMKAKTCCQRCETTNYTFDWFYFVSFNLNILKNKINPNSQISILDCFNIQNNTLINLNMNQLTCRKCKKIRPHLQRKQFYNYPKFLIICLDRGINCENKIPISYGMDLNLKGNCDYENSPIYYKLIGVVKRLDRGKKEHYISIYFDFSQNLWIYRDDSNCYGLSSPFQIQEGIDVMLFYIEYQMNNLYNNNKNFVHMQSNMNIPMNNNNMISNNFMGGSGNNMNMNSNQNICINSIQMQNNFNSMMNSNNSNKNNN